MSTKSPPLIRIAGNMLLQHPDLLIRLEGDTNYTNIYRVNQPKPLLISRTLLHFQQQLPGFLRISKSMLVNPAYIARYVKKGRVLHLRLTDDTLVVVARRRVAETMEALNERHQSAGSVTESA